MLHSRSNPEVKTRSIKSSFVLNSPVHVVHGSCQVAFFQRYAPFCLWRRFEELRRDAGREMGRRIGMLAGAPSDPSMIVRPVQRDSPVGAHIELGLREWFRGRRRSRGCQRKQIPTRARRKGKEVEQARQHNPPNRVVIL